jgi:hypothetical protein
MIVQDDNPSNIIATGPPGKTCDQLFLVQGTAVITQDAGVCIIFGVSHHGGSGGWNGSHFFPVCPGSCGSVTLSC